MRVHIFLMGIDLVEKPMRKWSGRKHVPEKSHGKVF